MQPIWVSSAEQPIRSREILKLILPGLFREISLVGIQQEYPKERIKKRIENVFSENRDLAIGSFQLGLDCILYWTICL